MPSFLENVEKFRGTGEKNENGQTLEEFLEAYDPYRYRTPSCTTDAVIFSYTDQLDTGLEGLKLLLVKRKNHPGIGYWALPGGFINLEENLDDTARRELEEETGVKGLVMEQIGTYGDYDRDPRTRVITTAYMALVEEHQVEVHAGDDAADAAWCEICLELKQTEWTQETEQDVYVLHIRNEDHDLHTSAIVKRTMTQGLIREEKYSVEEMGMLAADHAAIIVQALVLLKNRL